MHNLVLIGSSNGAGMINRIMIEMEEHPYRAVIQLVASLIEKQYHDGSFWVSSNSSNLYDIPRKPANPGPEVLYFHGSEDKVVPYNGGLRSGKFAHVSAQDTAMLGQKPSGSEGARIPDAQGGKSVKASSYMNILMHVFATTSFQVQGITLGPMESSLIISSENCTALMKTLKALLLLLSACLLKLQTSPTYY